MQKRHQDRQCYFNELANTSRSFYINYVKQFISLSSSTHILEIGCGTGKLPRCLIDRFPDARFTINDLSPEMKDYITALPFKQMSFKEGDAEKIDFNETYHLIASASTIQWFTD